MSVETLAQALLEAGILDTSSLAVRLPRARTGRQLIEGLIADGIVTEPSLVSQLARALSVPRYDPKERMPEPDAIALFDQKSATELGVLPVAVRGGGALLWVALCDPTDEPLLSEVSRRAGRRVKACLIGPRELTKALQQLQLGEAMAAAIPPPQGPITVPGMQAAALSQMAQGIPQMRPGVPPPVPMSSFAGVPNGYPPPQMTMPPYGGYPFTSGISPPQAPASMSVPPPGPPSRPSDVQRLEEELLQVRNVVKVLTQLLVERGGIDGDELKRRLRVERERKS